MASEPRAEGGKEPALQSQGRSRDPEAEADLAGSAAARRGWTGVTGALVGDGVRVMGSGHGGPLGPDQGFGFYSARAEEARGGSEQKSDMLWRLTLRPAWRGREAVEDTTDRLGGPAFIQGRGQQCLRAG